MTRMFHFITETWNPVKGCEHDCYYGKCWANLLAMHKLRNTEKYSEGFSPGFFPRELDKKFRDGDIIFVCSMGDMFGRWVPDEWIGGVFARIRKFPKTTFLLLTKNPMRYRALAIPTNCMVGATIETNRKIPEDISEAPQPSERLEAMKKLNHPNKFLCIEPIMDFDLEEFFTQIMEIKNLKRVAVGYDNYSIGLPEPPLKKTLKLIEKLEGEGIEVVRKTLREMKK